MKSQERRCEVGFDGNFKHIGQFMGKPLQGESNVAPATKAFISLLERDWGLSFQEIEDTSRSKEVRDIDARVRLRSGRHMNLQVVRCLEREFYKELSQGKPVERAGTLVQAATALKDTIERKTERCASRSNITLLIDGAHTPQVALFAPTIFVEQHGSWAIGLGWESIWVLGMSWANRLDLMPGEVKLPESWST